MKKSILMRKLHLGISLFLGWCAAAHAITVGRYVANEDIKADILMGQTVAGTMLLKKGRQFQVTGVEGAFIQVELGPELTGRLPSSAELKIGLIPAEKPPAVSPTAVTVAQAKPQSEKSVDAPAPKPEGALVIKGIYVGMPAEEAIRVLSANKPVPLRTIHAVTREERVFYWVEYGRRYGPDAQQIDWRSAGMLSANLKTRKVTGLTLYGELSDVLFNTGDLSATSFAKQLIDSYGIPELKPVTRRDESVWHYESAFGWSIYVSGDKTIELFQTPPRRFD